MRYHWVISCFALISFLFNASIFAADQEHQLSHVIAQIKLIKIALLKKHNKKDALQQELQQIETHYGKASQTQQKLQQQITQQKLKISQLEKTAIHQESKLLLHQQALSQQLRGSYLLRRQGPLKLLLNRQDINEFSRMLYYYQALNLYQTHLIAELHTKLLQIHDQQLQLYTQYQSLQRLQQQQKQEQENLAIIKQNRTQLITRISQTIYTQKQLLEQLSSDKKRLEETINQLKPAPLAPNYHNQHFATLRGHLPWPTLGKVQHYFNTQIAHSELRWTGELIEAADNQPIYAIADGTVVFAKWLEGYGLLLIINHGGDYMSLYGRNHSLYKKEGDSVSAGDLIATVGQSGGFVNPALYFAILHKAKPLDPNQWCT